MELYTHAETLALGKNLVSLARREETVLAENIDEISKMLLGHGRNHLLADMVDILLLTPCKRAPDGMSPQERGTDDGRRCFTDPADYTQNLQFVFRGKPVTAFDFDCPGALGNHFIDPGHRLAVQLFLGTAVQQVGGVQNSSAVRCYFRVRKSFDLVQKFLFASAGKHDMSMRVTECRQDHTAFCVNDFATLIRRKIVHLPEIGNAFIINQKPCVVQCSGFRHRRTLFSEDAFFHDSGNLPDILYQCFHDKTP